MKNNVRVIIIIGVVLLLVASGVLFIFFPPAKHIEPWVKPPAGPFSFDLYAEILKTHVDDTGMVNYKVLKEKKETLESFYAALDAVKPDELNAWSQKKQIAFWMNAYNALTLKLIVDNYPVDSIKDIKPPVGPWRAFEYNVAGRQLTLNGIEHDVLREEENGFNEPRLHVALVCAAMSCPPLRNEPYTEDNLDAQFDDQVRKMLAHPKKFKIDKKEKVVGLSEIFNWYGGDFIKTFGTDKKFAAHEEKQRAVLNYLSPFLSEADQAFLKDETYKVEYLEYDWSLNEQ